MPVVDELSLRLQAYSLAVQQGSDPDTVYAWLTQEGTPGDRPELATVYDFPASTSSGNTGPMPDPYAEAERRRAEREADPDERRREQFDHPSSRQPQRPEQAAAPEKNYLLNDEAITLAATFLRAFRVTEDTDGYLSVVFRTEVPALSCEILQEASRQADQFYGTADDDSVIVIPQ